MFTCKKCGSVFEIDWRKDWRTRREAPIPQFCSRTCSNARVQTDVANEKRRTKMKNKKVKFVVRHTWSDSDRSKSTEARIKNITERMKTSAWSELRSKAQRKRRLLFEQNNRCAICGIEPTWNGKALTFHYDHIDGKKATAYDNRRENLRMICPNCDSQTDTYCSKNASPEGRRRMAAGAHAMRKKQTALR